MVVTSMTQEKTSHLITYIDYNLHTKPAIVIDSDVGIFGPVNVQCNANFKKHAGVVEAQHKLSVKLLYYMDTRLTHCLCRYKQACVVHCKLYFHVDHLDYSDKIPQLCK